MCMVSIIPVLVLIVSTFISMVIVALISFVLILSYPSVLIVAYMGLVILFNFTIIVLAMGFIYRVYVYIVGMTELWSCS